MKIKEPPERHAAFLYIWAALFGGIPLLMVPVAIIDAFSPGNGEPSQTIEVNLWPVVFLLLFPGIAGIIVWFTVRRQRRGGFRLEDDGIHGAHDAEDGVVSWGTVSELVWRQAGPTTSIEVNGQPLPSGPALYAELRDGSAIRVMQRTAYTRRHHEQLDASIRAAIDQGLVPVPYRQIDDATPQSGAWPSASSPDSIDSPDDLADPPTWPSADG